MRHAAHVAHHSPGRLRIRIPAAKGNAAALEAIRSSLSAMAGVDEVVVNKLIGTITIHYDPRHHAAFQKDLAGVNSQQEVVTVEPPKLEELEDMGEMLEHEAAFLAEHSHSAKALVDWMNALDRAIKRATDNAVDFRVIAPLILAVGALLELGVESSTPVWLTLGLFSFNHFISLHSPPPKKDGANSGGPQTPARAGRRS